MWWHRVTCREDNAESELEHAIIPLGRCHFLPQLGTSFTGDIKSKEENYMPCLQAVTAQYFSHIADAHCYATNKSYSIKLQTFLVVIFRDTTPLSRHLLYVFANIKHTLVVDAFHSRCEYLSSVAL